MTSAANNRRATRRADEARRVRDLLRSDLTRGAYAGRRLPTEEQLMDEFGVARAAVREALSLLRAEGMIDRVQGIGTLDVHHKIVHELPDFHGVTDPEPGSMWSGQMRVSVLDWSEVPLPAMAAEYLDAEPGDRSLRVDYVANLDAQPIGMATNYVRWPEAGQLERAKFVTDWYALLQRCGLLISESTWLMEASLADEHDAELLGVAAGAPVMVAEQVIYGPDGAAFDFAVARSRGDRAAYLSRARRKPA
jgi:GntR family transcriptional regulator